MRTTGIWFFGMLGCSIFGGIFAALVDVEASILGVVAGICLFVCVRLWVGEAR